MPNPPSTEPLLEFQSLRKTYDGRSFVLKDVNLKIEQGEFFTLLGPSGSGKTTLLMIMAGFEDATSGEMVFKGRDLQQVPSFRRNFGVVFQNYALFPHMTVAQNIAFPLRQRGFNREEIKAQVTRAMAMVKLDAMGDRSPKQLSGGQQQRVALARALVFSPEVVLFDEPLGALDRRLREHMQLEIRRLHSELGISMIYVTHDQEEALVMSDRIAVFDQGTIQQIGSPDTVYERPNTSFVANFIGENNSLQGMLKAIDGTTCQVELRDGTLVLASLIGSHLPGASVNLAIRPEQLRIIESDGKDENVVCGSVVEKIYIGSRIRLRCLLDSTDMILAEIPPADGLQIQIGMRLSLAWQTSDCRALDPTNKKAERD
ncbi:MULTISPECIES: ABC transporter ATP-binding protein [Rhizobium/Agrobacterium group]|uniref:Spermidine/putrescine import ATP-binding protein PotA n=1 Tax=Rhizobium rhizogenes TaxID=359 RepID=A0A546X3C6_RHIRH|nr:MULTISPECIES: ABC transporter ATP-binding protein [Rhizobium/Agrobacterium group]TRA95261.1 ABC transporter ATP-binding protein [Rhizobium rhizogenes]